MRRALRLLLAAAILAGGSIGLGAPPGPQGEPPPDVEILADDGLGWEEDGARVSFLTGQVKIRKGEMEMSAERALIWTRPGSDHSVDEIYAEGNVVFRRGTQKLRAERMYFDVGRDRAMILEFKAQGFSEGMQQTFYLTAREARMTMGRLEGEGIVLSTCSYGVPHYHVEIKSATLEGVEPRPREHEMDLFPYEGWQFRADEVYPELMGAPVFFFPGLLLGPWVKDFPIRSIHYGRSSRFGQFLLSEFGKKIKVDDGTGKSRTWGEVIVEADWRQKRGGAWGLDLEYGWKGYNGFVDSYFLHDMGRDLEVGFETKFPLLKREERGRVHTFHRHDPHPDWRVEVETSYLSDRSLLEEFFEREFKESKEPESAAYIRWLHGPMGAYLLERHRLNDFQTQNEYLPRAGFSLLQVPILGQAPDNLYFTERFDMVHIRRRFDEETPLSAERVWRTDAVSELMLAYDLNLFQLSPFAQHRITAYEDDLQGETEFRNMDTVGGRLVTQVYGAHSWISWEGVGLRGIRHAAEIEIRYANTISNTVDPRELFPFESVDQLDEFEEVALEVNQRFLTQNDQGGKYALVSLMAGAEFYPDHERDTTGVRAGNTEAPFNWIGLAPNPKTGALEDRTWSNLHYDAVLTPRIPLSVRVGGEYNPLTGHEEVRETTVTATPLPRLTASVSHTFVRGVTDAYIFSGTWNLTEKWYVTGLAQYDFRIEEYLTHSFVLTRDYHDFLVQAVMERDFGRDDQIFYISFAPKFLGGDRGARWHPVDRREKP